MRPSARARLALLLLIGGGGVAADPPRIHTVFCAECTNNFDYKSLGVFWSHRLSGMPGNVTRLLACDEGGRPAPHGSRSSDMSPSYNKPGSIMHWVQESEEAKHVDYVLYIDADMLLRRPMDPIALGVKPGVVVSEHVGYLDVGIKNELPFEFLPPD